MRRIANGLEVWTTAAVSSVAGAVVGYCFGQALNKRPKKTNVARLSDQLERNSIHSQWSTLRDDDSPGFRQSAIPAGFADGRLVGLDRANPTCPLIGISIPSIWFFRFEESKGFPISALLKRSIQEEERSLRGAIQIGKPHLDPFSR